MTEILKLISDELEGAGVPYEFLEWTVPISYPYFVGEYSEMESITESGEFDKTFMLTGFSRGTTARLQLEQMRETILELFPANEGKIVTLSSGSVAAIFYASAFPVPSGEADLYKIQINLAIKQWKV